MVLQLFCLERKGRRNREKRLGCVTHVVQRLCCQGNRAHRSKDSNKLLVIFQMSVIFFWTLFRCTTGCWWGWQGSLIIHKNVSGKKKNSSYCTKSHSSQRVLRTRPPYIIIILTSSSWNGPLLPCLLCIHWFRVIYTVTHSLHACYTS